MAGSGLFATQQAQRPHLTAGGGQGKELRDLRQDVANEFSSLAAIAVEEYLNVPAAAAAGLKAATASSTSAVVFTAADLLLGGVLPFARPIVFTTAGVTPADVPPTVTVSGTDVKGRFLTETINLAQTATTATTTKCFKTVTKVEYPAGDGVAGTVAIGWAAGIGLPQAPKARTTASFTQALNEIVNGAAVAPTTATLSLASVNGPYGMYTPASAPNGTNDYCIYYEADMTVV